MNGFYHFVLAFQQSRVSLYGSWDMLQLLYDPELDKRKKMDGLEMRGNNRALLSLISGCTSSPLSQGWHIPS